METYLWDEFGVPVTTSSVSRTLRSAGRSKKKFRRKAVEQNPDLIDFYLYSISPFHSWQFVYVTPVQITKFHRGRRYQILPAYSQDGILLSRIFQGPTDDAVFEDFIEQLLHQQHIESFADLSFAHRIPDPRLLPCSVIPQCII